MPLQKLPEDMPEDEVDEVWFYAALDKRYHRLAVFLADDNGQILYKTDQLEANYCYPGELRQPIEKLASVSFQDVDNDSDTDIILIAQCHNDRGDYQEKSYKVGDVLFQEDGSFYRDYRISDKINRFDMNKNPACILNFVRDGRSTEFLYTAETYGELLSHNFRVIEEQSYTRNFEKLGKMKVVPGVYRMAEYDVFMIYLIDEQGNIVWSFQPMEDYDNLYALKGIQGKDLDGDGFKDLVVFAKYSYEGDLGELLVDTVCTVYYQRTAGFEKDKDFTANYECTEEDTLEALVGKIRAYWGWQT
ncbi:MAG: VCBS repeat-containing protein [Lachnospiraceae bacterium]|nr:VCBS repeat-containing protein [Lachnospiraceae bacterium]